MKLETNKLKAAHMAIKLLTHELTQKILNKLEAKPSNVGSLYKSLKIEQSVCSSFLAKMRKAGVIVSERKGKEQIYSIDTHGLEGLVNGALNIYKDLK